MTLEFLTPSGAVAHSPMERQARAAGARFEVRDGWNVAVAYSGPERERQALSQTAGWVDLSHVPRFEDGVDMTCAYGALLIAGPLARELIARFSAVDLRPAVCSPGDYKPVSIARTPGAVLVEDGDRYLLQIGAALGEYMWDVVADAGGRLGAVPVGVDSLDA
jgi:glycine cleavage system aminomethyltransferase T